MRGTPDCPFLRQGRARDDSWTAKPAVTLRRTQTARGRMEDPSFCPPRALRSGLRFTAKRSERRGSAEYDNLNLDRPRDSHLPPHNPIRNSFRFPHQLREAEETLQRNTQELTNAHYERIAPLRPAPASPNRFGCCREETEPWFGTQTSALILHPRPDSLRSELLPRPSSLTSDAPDPIAYDSETLRRDAAKNREVSKKLFRQLKSEATTQRRSSVHIHQSSWDSTSSTSPTAKTSLAKSPSQGSSSAGSSVYGDSSSSSSEVRQSPSSELRSFKMASSARGVSRKISARKKAAREGASLPDLTSEVDGWEAAGAEQVSITSAMWEDVPPLPRKPPPAFKHLPPDHPAFSILHKYGSTPCLVATEMQRKPVPPRRPSKEPSAEAPPLLPLSGGGHVLSHGGKPTVQVHPLCPNEGHSEDDSPPSSLILKINGEKPRPPVPKKPTFLSPRKPGKALAPQPPIQTPPKTPPRAQELTFVEDTCNRLSAFLSKEDERLRPILCPDSPPNESLNDSTATDDSDEVARAKFLSDIYTPSADLGSHPRPPSLPTQKDQIRQKKEELISSLTKKLDILSEEGEFLQEETEANDRLAESVIEALMDKGSTAQVGKLRSIWGDSGRLEKLEGNLRSSLHRVEKALARTGPEAPERRLLTDRAARLQAQLQDALLLSKGLATRKYGAKEMVESELVAEKSRDWEFALESQRRLIADRRELDEKLQLGRDQIAALSASL